MLRNPNVLILLLAIAQGCILPNVASSAGKQTTNPISILHQAENNTKLYSSTGNKAHRDNAINLLRRYLKHEPGNTGAKITLYRLVLSKVGERQGKTRHLKELKALFKQTPIIKELDVPPPSTAEAVHKLKRITTKKQIKEVLQLLQDGLREDPNDIATRNLLARLYLDLEQPVLALALMRQVMKLAPEELKDKRRSLYGIALFDVAFKYRCDQPNPYIDEALQQIKKALSINPANSDLEHALADLYSYKGLHPLSVYTSKKLFEREPTPYNKMQLADHYWFSGDNKSALDLYKTLYTDKKLKKEAYRQTGRLMFGDGNWKQAIKYLKKYIASPNSSNFYPKLLLAIAEHELYGEKPMQKRLKTITAKDADKAWKKTLLDFHLAKIDAEELKDRANNICEKTEAYYFLGMNLLKNGKASEAKKQFQNVVDLKFPMFIEYRFAQDALARM